ncbi:hypothetical protein [Hyphomicrobium sp.]|uniref:hypothetical protein n=1 Tax=Hyphomicrobium sp. TaxID=82 RepID=UPI0025C3BE3A|nr:hypothetical protein [Hyphomicrobium sp.]MCC7252596.1 hypothetical protein [Hyphomicrobium sp.]
MTTAKTRQARSLWRVFSVPFWIAVTSSIGLVTALVGDGLLDFISWVCLAIPLVVSARYLVSK